MSDRTRGGSRKELPCGLGIGIWPTLLIMSVRRDQRSMRYCREWVTMFRTCVSAGTRAERAPALREAQR
jgi:hypothetical protein